MAWSFFATSSRLTTRWMSGGPCAAKSPRALSCAVCRHPLILSLTVSLALNPRVFLRLDAPFSRGSSIHGIPGVVGAIYVGFAACIEPERFKHGTGLAFSGEWRLLAAQVRVDHARARRTRKAAAPTAAAAGLGAAPLLYPFLLLPRLTRGL